MMSNVLLEKLQIR